jgi:hypothetical protein
MHPWNVWLCSWLCSWPRSWLQSYAFQALSRDANASGEPLGRGVVKSVTSIFFGPRCEVVQAPGAAPGGDTAFSGRKPPGCG